MKHSYLLIPLCLILAGTPGQARTAQPDSILTTATAVRLGEAELERASGLDLRSRLIGHIPGLEVIEHTGQTLYSTTNIGSPWFASSAVTFASKGWSSLTCFVDGVPVPFQEFLLDPNQIESVQFVTDVSDKAAVSPLASSGAIVITTKQGQYNTPMRINVTAESGISFVDKMPGWSDGVAYARLNNLARGASGYTTLYDEDAIAGFAAGDMYDLYTPNVDYKSLLLRDWKPTTRVGLNVGGGTANIKYNVSLNGLHDGDLFKVGPTADYNKINLSSSVTARIGRYIEARASFLGMVGIRRGNRSSSLYAWRSTPAVAFPVALGRSLGQTDLDSDKEGTMIYAVSRNFTTNPYAAVVDGGYFVARARSGMFNADIDIDLGWLLPGLKTRSLVNFGSFYYINAGKTNDYIAYYWDASDGIVDLSSHVGTKQASKSTLATASYQSLNFQQDLLYDWAKGGHDLKARASYYISDAARTGTTYYERLQMGVGRVDYTYGGRYAANFTCEYAGGSPYAPDVRYAFFPTVGAAWMASNEAFLRKASWIDRLKVWAQVGRIGYSNIFESNYLYQGLYSLGNSEIYGPATAYQWFGSDKQTVETTNITRIANPGLTWPKITEYDAGIDSDFLGQFSLGLKGYLINRTGIHTNTMSEYIGAYGWNGIAYYENYNAKRTVGGEMRLDWTRTFGDLRMNLGGWATTWRTTNTKLANDAWLYEWQKATGREESDYTGYVCIGKFETPEQIASLPKLDENGTQVGDLMYADLNGDGIIDANDMKVVGNTNPRLRYALHLDLQWKDFGLAMTGVGRAFYDIACTNTYFWNGWGDGNYSQFVVDNLGGAYPRLSYEKSSTNFVASDFWLRKGGWFKLKSVELSYTLRPSVSWLQAVRFTLTGGNLFTLTGLDYVDPEDISAGITAYPFYRTVLAGVKLSF